MNLKLEWDDPDECNIRLERDCLSNQVKSRLALPTILASKRSDSLTLQVHHWNRQRKDNREENLVALCSACHLSYHYLGHSNVTPGQLELEICL